MTMTALPQPLTYPIHYPESDGRLLAETDWHRTELINLLFMLQDRYRDDPNVYVTGVMFFYYEEGNPAAMFAPDACIVFGVPKRMRRVYKLWDEKVPPTVVFELSSRSTWLEDKGNKMALCASLGVEEYYLFDPELDYLKPPLQGYRLEEGVYRPMTPDAAGALQSERLGLTLHQDGGRLELVDTTGGQPLLRPDAVQREAEARISYAEMARREAEARAAAEAKAREAAEAEAARLRAELERLHRGLPPQPPDNA